MQDLLERGTFSLRVQRKHVRYHNLEYMQRQMAFVSLCVCLSVSLSLCLFFNCYGGFSLSWKAARVTPIHKAQAKNDLNNYRLISVISPIVKAFEKMVYTQLYEYLSINNLLSKYQSGFRRLHSTTTALLDATTEWFLNMDMGKLNSVVFLDLSKAFDTVDHSILLIVWYFPGISDMV